MVKNVNKMTKLYCEQGVEIYGVVSSYTSLLGYPYQGIDKIKIFKNEKLVYKNNLDRFYLKNMINNKVVNLNDWVDDIIYFVKYTDGDFELKSVLNKFFINYDYMLLEVEVKKLKNKNNYKKRLQQSKKEYRQLSNIQRELKKLLDDKLIYNSFEMYIITEDFKKYLNKNKKDYNKIGLDIIDRYKTDKNFLNMAVEREIIMEPTIDKKIKQCKKIIEKLK